MLQSSLDNDAEARLQEALQVGATAVVAAELRRRITLAG